MVEDNSGAPVEGEVSAEARQHSLAGMMESQKTNKDFTGEEVEAHGDEGVVAFVAAARYANYKFLAKIGKPTYTPQEGANKPGMRTREGDVKGRFVNGVLATDNPDIISWCDANPSICRRSNDPATKGWVTLQALAVQLANRERLIDPTDMNPDETFPPGMGDEEGVRQFAAKAGSEGNQLVESAELTKKSVEQNK